MKVLLNIKAEENSYFSIIFMNNNKKNLLTGSHYAYILNKQTEKTLVVKYDNFYTGFKINNYILNITRVIYGVPNNLYEILDIKDNYTQNIVLWEPEQYYLINRRDNNNNSNCLLNAYAYTLKKIKKNMI